MAPVTRRTNGHVRKPPTRLSIPKDELVELNYSHGKACMFCGRKEISEKLYGLLYQLNEVVVHYFCILLSSRAVQNGLDKEGIWGFLLKDIKTELLRGSRELCTYCEKPGATISCCTPRCRKIFHLPCGLKNGSMHQFFQTFKSFCQQHRIAQNIDMQDMLQSAPVQCSICKEDVIPNPLPSSIWAPCCKRNAWFHRDCIQELALNAGYFFKCPLCNNVELFKSRMLILGIYIPSSYVKKLNHRDASWETVPNAFAELLERHSTCNADTCLCPHNEKRNYHQETGSWEIILCHACGSYGTHKLCSSLKCNQQWYCKSCHNIADNSDVAKKRRLEITGGSNNSISTANLEEMPSSHTSTLIRSNIRVRQLNSVTRERPRQNRSNREIPRNNTAQNNNVIVPQQAVEIISLLSDDEDDHENNAENNESNGIIMRYAYVDPPNQVISHSLLPIITSYTSMSTSSSSIGNNFRSKNGPSSTQAISPYCPTGSIDLTLDDEEIAS